MIISFGEEGVGGREEGGTASGAGVDTRVDDLGLSVGGLSKAGIVDEVGSARVAGHKDPVATLVNVEDDCFALVEVVDDLGVRGRLGHEGETELADRAPDKGCARIATISTQPSIQSSWVGSLAVDLATTVVEDH